MQSKNFGAFADQYTALSKHYRWLPDTRLTMNRIPLELARIVTGTGSLTAALIELGDGDFQVRLLNQQVAVPYFHEQRKLDRPLSRAAVVREVELIIKGVPVVFARSILPISIVTQGARTLANLGQKPLGHLLFKDGRMRVSKREFCFQKLIVARRTPYEYQGSIILVAEFFLPALKELL